MRCDDADVMMMQKKTSKKSNLGKNPGHYSGLRVPVGKPVSQSRTEAVRPPPCAYLVLDGASPAPTYIVREEDGLVHGSRQNW